MSQELFDQANKFASSLANQKGYSPNTVKSYLTDVLDFVKFSEDKVQKFDEVDLGLLRQWLWLGKAQP